MAVTTGVDGVAPVMDLLDDVIAQGFGVTLAYSIITHRWVCIISGSQGIGPGSYVVWNGVVGEDPDRDTAIQQAMEQHRLAVPA